MNTSAQSDTIEIRDNNLLLVGCILVLCTILLFALGCYGFWQMKEEANRVGIMSAIMNDYLISGAIVFAFFLGSVLAIIIPETLLRGLKSLNSRLTMTSTEICYYRGSKDKAPIGRIPYDNIETVDWDHMLHLVKITLRNPQATNTFWSSDMAETMQKHQCHIVIPELFEKSTHWISRRIEEKISPANNSQ